MNQNIFRNLIVVILLCILSITTFVINPTKTSKDNKKEEINDIASIDETIVVFLESNIEPEKIENIKKEIMAIISKNDEILFKSKEQIKQEMIDESETIAGVLNELDENPLSDTFYIKIKNKNNIHGIIDYIKQIDGVYQVGYSSVLDKSSLQTKKRIN